jgi:hypothetical protein
MATNLTAQEAERLVREAWEYVFPVLRGDDIIEFEIRNQHNKALCWGDWLKLHAFTVQRQREIAEIGQALEWIRDCIDMSGITDQRGLPEQRLIESMLTAKLAELLHGTKGAR